MRHDVSIDGLCRAHREMRMEGAYQGLGIKRASFCNPCENWVPGWRPSLLNVAHSAMMLPIFSATRGKIGLAKSPRRKEILAHRKTDDEQDRDGNQASQAAIIRQERDV